MKSYLTPLINLWFILTLLAMPMAQAAERVTYYHTNVLGSPVAATDHSGAVVWREQYKPYGRRMLKEDGGTNQLWYTGKAHEEHTELSYYGARWYHPELGRFMAIDPVDFQEGNVQSFNRYAYANNNPYKYVDPDGNSPITAGSRVSYGIARVTVTPAINAGIRLLTSRKYLSLGDAIYGVLNESSDSSQSGAGEGNRTQDSVRKDKQREKRNKRRENRSRGENGNGQNESGKGFREEGRKEANKGPSGERKKGPDRSNNRERNRGVGGEEHSIKPKSSGGDYH